MDLQIIPKYACDGVNWASDLLFLSLFTTFGRLDALHSIAAGMGEENALAELAARVLLELVARNARSPLRIRRRVTFTSFEPDEDIDPDDMLIPEDEGWTQTGYRLTFDNEYASTLSSACRVLLPHVRRLETRAMLTAQISRFGPQTHEPLRVMHRLPSRLAKWQTALELALAILGGNSLSPQSGSLSTLGFSVSTWRTWEALIERSLVLGLGGAAVRLQPRLELGTLRRGDNEVDILVQPDAMIAAASGDLVIDAKYKGRADQSRTTVSSTDRYEILAFMLAAGSAKAALIYPSTNGNELCGSWKKFETFKIPSGTVSAFTLNMTGISSPGGFTTFLNGLKEVVHASQARYNI
ncbi:hypothetical protein ACBY01_01470 [Sphingomonas sp. ac-8]|uniref:5-methylcytosine restriction system specificity protein McrC n=1 Tax=Sphingomonas sp. ac-8 TaxID=3242977 RepID=UPI003A804486